MNTLYEKLKQGGNLPAAVTPTASDSPAKSAWKPKKAKASADPAAPHMPRGEGGRFVPRKR